MSTLKAKNRQSLLDMQLIASGSLEGLIDLCRLNDLPVTAELQDGQEVTLGEVADARTARLYALRGISPATAIEETGDIIMGGIGYMAVQVDFIVIENAKW